ncbi:MAG: ATPase, T2SS/T4P/T4SS family [Candidatus Ancaeobacter aquaticus]|nr:ATPase, T2SS/T4P/T4SS family [Candidatus Ancaeobacter aquaticus]
MKSLKERLVEILLDSNLITNEKLEEAYAIQKKQGGKLRQVLVENGFVKEKDLIASLSEHLIIPPIDLSRVQIDQAVLDIIPKDIAFFYQLIPISKVGENLTVAMADPLNVFAIDDIKIMTGFKVNPVIAGSKDINEALTNYYLVSPKMESILEDTDTEISKVDIKEEEDINVDKMMEAVEEAPVIKAVNYMVIQALKDKASDIHLEPFRDLVRLRSRIDGILYEKAILPKKIQAAMISRVKIMANLDITEKRLPQDGRFRIKAQGRYIDFRVSTLPSIFGEKIVIRVLDKGSQKMALDKLGFHDEGLEDFKEALVNPYGMILVTGPTGSGKTTTLYSALNEINKPEVNIITVEDPVEYQLPGVNQVQVKPDIGFTFASALRSILRQDPNIVMIGEIRDQETADIAIRAALTGHLVLSTLHTNDAASTITRLSDMGLEPFLISSSVLLVAAQRLVRKICPACKKEIEIAAAVLDVAQISHEGGKKQQFFKGKGCRNCGGSGYAGRMSLIETLKVTDPIRELIAEKTSAKAIKDQACKDGMKTLRMVGLDAVRKGLTTVEEVLRETSKD